MTFAEPCNINCPAPRMWPLTSTYRRVLLLTS